MEKTESCHVFTQCTFFLSLKFLLWLQVRASAFTKINISCLHRSSSSFNFHPNFCSSDLFSINGERKLWKFDMTFMAYQLDRFFPRPDQILFIRCLLVQKWFLCLIHKPNGSIRSQFDRNEWRKFVYGNCLRKEWTNVEFLISVRKNPCMGWKINGITP